MVPKEEGEAHVDNKSWDRTQGPSWEVGGKALESSACFSDSGQMLASGSISFKCVMEEQGSFPH